jgi:uncharacterized protein YkwD
MKHTSIVIARSHAVAWAKAGDEAIQGQRTKSCLFLLDCFASLAMTVKVISFTLAVCIINPWHALAEDPTKFSAIEFKDDYSDEERKLLDLTNKVRVGKGLQALTMNIDLTKVARDQSADMARHHHLSHTVKGKHLEFRIKKSGYDYRTVGENIARSKGPLHHVVQMWMHSPNHRKNILNSQFKEIGFGIIKAKNGYRYFTQVFGAQR